MLPVCLGLRGVWYDLLAWVLISDFELRLCLVVCFGVSALSDHPSGWCWHCGFPGCLLLGGLA